MSIAATPVTADLTAGLTVGTVVGGLAGLLVLAGVAWWGWRHIDRRVKRGRWWWQRNVLRVQAVVLPLGPRRDVVRMRLAVHDNVAQSQRVMRHQAVRDGMPAGGRDLLPHLEHLAAGLDVQLRLWQTEPDRALVRGALPALLARGDAMITQAVSLRVNALPLIDEADRLARAAAEAHLRAQLEALDTTPVAVRQLPAPSGLQDSQLRIDEAAPRG